MDASREQRLKWMASFKMLEGADWAELQDLRRARAPPQGRLSVAGWCEAVRQARLEGERVFVVMHLFAGARRPEDVQHFLELIMNEMGLKLLMISAAFGRIGMYGVPTQSLTRPPRSSGDEASSADARGHVVISLRG